MTKKVFWSIFTVAAAVLISCFLIIMGVLYDYFDDMQQNQLVVQTKLAAQGVSNEGMNYFNGLDSDDYRITWVGEDGKVLYDNEADVASMENHATHKEIKQAFEEGVGVSERYSATMLEKTIYRAQLLDDGTVIRISVKQSSVVVLLLGMLQPVIVVVLIALILSFILSRRMAKRIVKPLNELDLDNPLENNTYEELSPLLTRIEKQHREIKYQIDKLQRTQDEFSAVTENMSEGLVLLGENSKVLSMNRAAARLFGTTTASVGKSFLSIDRSIPMQDMLTKAWAGQNGYTDLVLSGREYRLSATPVVSEGETAGVCLIAIDVTDKAQAERIRREFTANVSHELKTPLQSIMGSAELIENGIARQEDVPDFAGKIRTESARLVDLIDDIIRLSQLDESSTFPKETVNLKELAEEAVKTLSTEAATNKVTLEMNCTDVKLKGVRRLLYEIIYNLCDNGIKYNKPGGKVDIYISKENNNAVLSVSDTGIGIPEGDRTRVFERFYRIDKSHSRQIGGTGLGLSIVKHAAEYHGGEILLESIVEKGTTITVKFPIMA